MEVLLTTCGAWHLRDTARAFETRNALAALWCTERNRTGIAEDRFRRCWPFHLAMAPFYVSERQQIWRERAFYALFPFWRLWQQRQPWPRCDVVHSVMGYATEPFERAETSGVLKVLECCNSHPSTYYGFWQRECDIFCPGQHVPIPRWMFVRMTRELERADVILCPSDFVRETLLRNGIPAEKCFLNPFGVDTAIFQTASTAPTLPRFLCVGTICLRKGHQYLFRAFEKVKRRLPEAELICVGTYKRDFRNERPRWEGTFRHYPALPQREVAKLLQSGTAFVLASVEEGLARVIPEALASGLPVVATQQSGAETLVTDGVEGFIVPARDVDRTADALLRLALDPLLRRDMAAAARKKGAVKNTWQDYGDRLLAEYAQRLARKRS